MAREIHWLVQRIEERDPITLEVLRYGNPREVPRAKVMEDNFATPGVWKVVDQNPNGINDSIYAEMRRAEEIRRQMGGAPPVPAEWGVRARSAPEPIKPGK